MKNVVNANDLYFGNIWFDPKQYKFFDTNEVGLSKNKYLFVKNSENEFREVFTEIVAYNVTDYSILEFKNGELYIENLTPLTQIMPELTNTNLDKKNLLLLSHYILKEHNQFIPNRPEKEAISLAEMMCAEDYSEALEEAENMPPRTTYFANTTQFSPQRKRLLKK